jgi:2,2-dialkylglycine decarboxylase (pyruvate)
MDPRFELLIRYAGNFAPYVVGSASGSFVTTVDGRRVLDFTAGQICATIGHNHPRVVEAIEQASRSVLHLNSWTFSEPVLELAERLVRTVPPELDRVMFLSTGGEGVEAAVRMAKMSTGGFELASLTRGWHGLTAGAAALTLAGGRRGYGPNPPGVFALPAPYAYRCPIKHCVDTCDSTCLEAGFDLFDQASVGAPAAVVAEPVLSAGGVIVPPPDYFTRLLTLCHERGMALILDECQTGLGRLGSMYGFEIYQIVPDFLVLSKTLGGGIPISAVLTSARVEQTCYERGLVYIISHTSDPMPAAAALAVLDVVEQENLAAQAKQRGDYLLARLRELQDRHEVIGDVRGMGLLSGIELVEDRETRNPARQLGVDFTNECENCGLSVNLVRGRTGGNANCVRMAPPLTISIEEIDLAVSIMDDALTRTTDRAAPKATGQVSAAETGQQGDGGSMTAPIEQTEPSVGPSTLRRLVAAWPTRATVRTDMNRVLQPGAYDHSLMDYPVSLLPIATHPDFLAASDAQRLQVNTLAWLAYNDRVIATEEYVANPTFEKLGHGVYPGVDRFEAREAIQQSHVDEVWHTHMHMVAMQRTREARGLTGEPGTYGQPVANRRLFVLLERASEQWERDLLFLLWATVAEMSISKLLDLLAGDPTIEPMHALVARLHARDEAAHGPVIGEVVKDVFVHLTKQQRAFVTANLPDAILSFGAEDYEIWLKILDWAGIPRAQTIVADSRTLPGADLLVSDFTPVRRLVRDLEIEHLVDLNFTNLTTSRPRRTKDLSIIG